MYAALRNLSPRPTLLVDEGPNGAPVVDPQSATIGTPGPLGRARIVAALPLNDGPVQVVAPLVVHDGGLAYLADSNGNLIGDPGIRVSRMVTARWVQDTRRLGG